MFEFPSFSIAWHKMAARHACHKTQWQMFCDATAVMFVPLGRAQTWLYKFGWHTSAYSTQKKNSLVRLLILQSSIISWILEFIYWIVTVFSSDHMTGENRELLTWGCGITDLVWRSSKNDQGPKFPCTWKWSI